MSSVGTSINEPKNFPTNHATADAAPSGATIHTGPFHGAPTNVTFADDVVTPERRPVMAIVEPESPEQSMARRIAAEIAAMPAAIEVVQRLRPVAASWPNRQRGYPGEWEREIDKRAGD